MGMNIKNPTVERLARELAGALGETMTSAIQHALEEKLNIGDCFAYALSKARDELLFKGNDFAQTDVEAAL